MTIHLADAVALLGRTPRALDALLRGLPDTWIGRSEGPGTWTALDVVGHLIHGEHTDWIPRTRRILESGDSKAFEKFDRGGHAELVRGKTMDQLLDQFARDRGASLRTLEELSLTPAQLELRGRHPELGVVTLSQLLATWAAHDLTHLHQLSRLMARQYEEAVGPWTVYLGVFQCAGHSSPAISPSTAARSEPPRPS
jgi:hypothetical protein